MIQFLALFTSLTVVSCVLFHLITPDDLRHANYYCSKNSLFKYQLVGNKFADNKEAHCFVKCFLKRTGLINLTTLGIDEEKFNNQNQGPPGNRVYFKRTLDGSCRPYYDEWMQAMESEGHDWIQSGFYFHENDELNFDTKYPLISKPIGQSALYLCSKRKDLDIVLCLYSYLRLFDAYGRIDNIEVIGAFRNCSPKKVPVQKCVHDGNTFYGRGPVKMASQLSSCLQRNCAFYKKILRQLIQQSTNF